MTKRLTIIKMVEITLTRGITLIAIETIEIEEKQLEPIKEVSST